MGVCQCKTTWQQRWTVSGFEGAEECSTVIDEYTGKMIMEKRTNKDSQHIVEMDDSTIFDAENEGNWTKLINHWCQGFNSMLILVRTGSIDTVFVKLIKPIQKHLCHSMMDLIDTSFFSTVFTTVVVQNNRFWLNKYVFQTCYVKGHEL